MVNSRAALGCLIASAVFGLVFHPRIVFGDGSGSGFINLNGVYFGAQWLAFLLVLAALGMSANAWLNTGAARTPAALWLPACSVVMLMLLFVFGVPHKANEGDWRRGETGAAAFVRGMARSRKANAKPVNLTADSFRGEWRAVDGAVFTFAPTSVSWKSSSGNGEYSAAACGSQFALQYVQRDREILQDNGITWSLHANALYASTAADAKIPTAEVNCGGSDLLLFIRASDGEVWRGTNSLDLEAIKNDSYVLRLNSENK